MDDRVLATAARGRTVEDSGRVRHVVNTVHVEEADACLFRRRTVERPLIDKQPSAESPRVTLMIIAR
ncbi:hypothetical protein ACLBWH_15280 [Sphingomonas sp. M6A6_1c]